MTTKFCTAFIEIALACSRVYGKPLPDRIMELGNPDRGWHVTFNNTDAMHGVIDPFDSLIRLGGMPAGVISPNGGIIAASEEANEQKFISWLRALEKE